MYRLRYIYTDIYQYIRACTSYSVTYSTVVLHLRVGMYRLMGTSVLVYYRHNFRESKFHTHKEQIRLTSDVNNSRYFLNINLITLITCAGISDYLLLSLLTVRYLSHS
jgi:UDP-N-acetylmuramyl pentapeptide phosphotransferase/UDP-N-acetylglucosamine-1-phosphate transferase